MSETTTPGLPTYPPFTDFTHRHMRPDHVAPPTPRGIPYHINMTSQKAASLLNKVASKPKLKMSTPKTRTKSRRKKK